VDNQEYTDMDITAANVNLKLGDAAQTVFGKKFKVRVTSKVTGRKIDINLTVKPPITEEDVVV